MAARGRPEVDPWGFLLPFSNSMWAATLVALGFVVVVTSAVVAVGAWMSPREMPCCWWRAALDLVFVYCGVLCQQSVEAKQITSNISTNNNKNNSIKECGRWAGRAVAGGWVVAAMVLAWAYMGGLTSLLAVRYVPQPFQTLAALGRHASVLLLVQENSAEAHLLQTGSGAVMRGMERVRKEGRLREVQREYQETYLPMAQGKPWVIVAESSSAAVVNDRHFSLTGRCDYYTSREIIVSYTYSIILQKNSPLLRAVNSRVQAVIQGGLYGQWLKESLPNATYCRFPPSVITVQDKLGLTNLWGVFTVLAGGLGASILVFVCEVLSAPRRVTTA
ncbi:glutamate receptor 1-like [Eriocheir sinensis]|uniref:glutamate receptor 1-like n=1 Tax=Eriocheir sinensis TaxID=95602 RepID=UPI0021C71F45|nr:glutamate receptor 1-like [Eriocheir sinensis]